MADERVPSGPPPGAYQSAPPSVPTGGFAPGVPPLAAPPPEIKLGTSSSKPTAKAPDKKAQPHDSFRELIETIVFVVVLVLILKTFLAEAFVIPTGSMATTLLGYHKEVTCQQCGHRFLVNTSKEADPAEQQPDERRVDVVEGTCPNCFFRNKMR
jgi:signal peptidase I